MNNYYVYFLTNKTNEVLYVGITNNLERRLHEHRSESHKGFSSQYRTYKLVYFETYCDPENAISREKQIKNWRRKKKDVLVNMMNSDWKDLSDEWYQPDSSASELRSSARNDIYKGK